MHNASTKQRLSALRRRLGIFTGWRPRWVKERERRLARLEVSSAAGAVVNAPAPRAAPDTVTELERTAPDAWISTAPGEVESTRAASVETVAVVEATTEPQVSAPRPKEFVRAPPAGDVTPAPTARKRGRAVAIVAAAIAIAVVAVLLAALRDRRPAPDASVAAPAPAGAPARSPELPAPVAAPSRPGPPAPGVAAVEVRRGDTLWHLAAVHLGDPERWPELHAANRDRIRDPDLIFPGQRVQLPAAARPRLAARR